MEGGYIHPMIKFRQYRELICSRLTEVAQAPHSKRMKSLPQTEAIRYSRWLTQGQRRKTRSLDWLANSNALTDGDTRSLGCFALKWVIRKGSFWYEPAASSPLTTLIWRSLPHQSDAIQLSEWDCCQECKLSTSAALQHGIQAPMLMD